MTLMVRDEADIVGPMLDHHIAQGVDKIIVTDNGSVDGTLELLQSYAEKGIVDLRQDPVHLKQQHTVVTAMARDAYSLYGADWVLNADADEFWIPKDPALRLRDVFERIPASYQAFPVPVIDMTGEPALSGTGLQRLIYRDERPIEEMNSVGVLNHSTPDAVHIGHPEIVIGQGNHFVNLDSRGQPGEDLAIEVLHLPWRSWEQFRRKVENSGLAYKSNPNLSPSPNHHGTREFMRLQEGSLLDFYLLRHPIVLDEDSLMAETMLRRDDRLARELVSPVPDVRFPLSLAQATWAKTAMRNEDLHHELDHANQTTRKLAAALDAKNATVRDLEDLMQAERARKIVRAVDGGAELLRRLAGRTPEDIEELESRRTNDRRKKYLDRLLRAPIRPVFIRGDRSIDAVPVIMCLWNRPQRLPEMIRRLTNQETPRKLRLVLWNNYVGDEPRYVSDLQALDELGAISSMELYSSKVNIGGIGRFVAARYLWQGGQRGPFIMVDDDQNIDPGFVDDLIRDWRPRSIVAWWAFRNHGSYWNRSEIAPGDEADHAGTGGTIADLELVERLDFFDIPARFIMLEDQWMTAYTRKRGWPVRKADTSIEPVLEETNQYLGLVPLKDEFYAFLNA